MPRGHGTHIMNIILINLSVYNDAQLVLCVMILAHAAVWPKCCLTLAGSSWKIGENISAWLYFSKLFMISYWCLTRIYYSRRTHEQDRLTSSSTELYVPLRTHINILFFLELYLNGICYTRTLLIPKPSTNLRVGSSHHPPHPCARPPPAWSWLPAFSWLRTASSSPPLLGSHTPPEGYTEYSSRQRQRPRSATCWPYEPCYKGSFIRASLCCSHAMSRSGGKVHGPRLI